MSAAYSPSVARLKRKATLLFPIVVLAFYLSGCASKPLFYDLDTGLSVGAAERVSLAASGSFVAAANPSDGSVSVFPLDWSKGDFTPEAFALPPRRIDLADLGMPLDVAWGESGQVVDVCYAIVEEPGGGIGLVRFSVSQTLSLSLAEPVDPEERYVALFDDEGGDRDPLLDGGIVKEGRFKNEQMLVRVVPGVDAVELIFINSTLRTGSVGLGWASQPPRVHTIPIPRGRPMDVALSPGGDLVFVACPGLGIVRVIDTERAMKSVSPGSIRTLARPAL